MNLGLIAKTAAAITAAVTFLFLVARQVEQIETDLEAADRATAARIASSPPAMEASEASVS